MVEIVIATGNRHKFRELRALLAVRGIRWRPLADYAGVPAVRETGRTFEANAVKKALAVARATGQLALADDSGLEVAALGWGPGVRSARFAGAHGDDELNNRKLLHALRGLSGDRRLARYRCVLALAEPPPSRWRRSAGRGGRSARSGGAGVLAVTRGTWAGRIAETPRGRRGFGYDPVFLVPGTGKTVGQLPASLKQRLSHRAHAARRMASILRRVARAERARNG
jgi:XTP/dITP diphosphohydrolase